MPQRVRQLAAGSINSVAFAPHDLGLIFVAASSDGNLSVHSCHVETGEWSVSLVQNEGGVPAHPMGAMAATFASALEPGALVGRGKKQVRFYQQTVPVILQGALRHARIVDRSVSYSDEVSWSVHHTQLLRISLFAASRTCQANCFWRL
jgi:hypothetical protein